LVIKEIMKKRRNLQIKAGLENSIPDRRLIKLNAAQIESLKSVAGVVLAVVGVIGVVALAAVAPNLFSAIGKVARFAKTNKPTTREEKLKKLRRTFYYLKQSGLIQLKPEAGEVRISLTAKGREKLQKIFFESIRIPKPKGWNKKWWLVAADIPTKDYRLAADKFRRKLRDVGFYPLQRTLWLFPYDPRVEVQFIAETFGIQNFITMMEINRLDKEDESVLKKFFGL